MPSPEPAIARWLAHGITSRSHPVLHWALRIHLQPLGIAADALECEPFSALQSGSGDWWLTKPRWAPALLDAGHPGAPDFRLFLENPESFAAEVDPHGLLTFRLSRGAVPGPAAARLWEEGEHGWLAARHSVRAAHDAEAFILGAAALILKDGRAAALYASGDDAGFCREASRRISG
jgi:hypothetical protein